MKRILLAIATAVVASVIGIPASPAQAAGEAIVVGNLVMYEDDCAVHPYTVTGDFTRNAYWWVDTTVVTAAGAQVASDSLSYSRGSSTGAVVLCPSTSALASGVLTLRSEVKYLGPDSQWVTSTVSAQFTIQVLRKYATAKREAIRRNGHRIWKVTGTVHAPDPAYEWVRIEMRWHGSWRSVTRKLTKDDGTFVFTARPKRTARFDPGRYLFRLNWPGLGLVTHTFRLPAVR